MNLLINLVLILILSLSLNVESKCLKLTTTTTAASVVTEALLLPTTTPAPVVTEYPTAPFIFNVPMLGLAAQTQAYDCFTGVPPSCAGSGNIKCTPEFSSDGCFQSCDCVLAFQ